MSDGVEMRAAQTVSAPFAPADLAAFIATVPAHAEIMVSTREGGSQREPYPTAFVFSASWEAMS